MKTQQVRDFHVTFDLSISKFDFKTRLARINLIREECREVEVELRAGTVVGLLKELSDLIYAALGAAVEMGLDLEPFFDEVHRSNMSKVGGHRDGNGKWVKPAAYSPADIVAVMASTYHPFRPQDVIAMIETFKEEEQ